MTAGLMAAVPPVVFVAAGLGWLFVAAVAVALARSAAAGDRDAERARRHVQTTPRDFQVDIDASWDWPNGGAA